MCVCVCVCVGSSTTRNLQLRIFPRFGPFRSNSPALALSTVSVSLDSLPRPAWLTRALTALSLDSRLLSFPVRLHSLRVLKLHSIWNRDQQQTILRSKQQQHPDRAILRRRGRFSDSPADLRIAARPQP